MSGEAHPSRPAFGWKSGALFVLLLAAISYVPWAGHRATVEAALEREKERHSLLVGQVANRVRQQIGHIVDSMNRLSESVMALDLDDPHVADEVRATWTMLTAFDDADAMQLASASERAVLQLGLPEREAEPALRQAASQARRSRSVSVSEAPPTGDGRLRVAVAAPVVRPDGTVAGAVVVSVDVEKMIHRLFVGTYGQSGVTFTIRTGDGGLLLHSGVADMGHAEAGRGRDAARCRSCHEETGSWGEDERRSSARSMTFSGAERVVAFAPVSVGGIVWTISASTPVEDVQRPFARQAVTFLGFTAGVSLLLVIMGAMLRRTQIRAVRLADDLAAQRQLLALSREKERLDRELEASRRLGAIGEMVARVAHEVKNPLQYIGTGVDLLSERVKDPAVGGLVSDIKTGVRTLDAIVKELLDFARSMNLDKSLININDIARDAAARAARAPSGRGDVKLSLAEDLPAVRADGYKLVQVMENLLRNAQEALPQTGGVVELSTAVVTHGRCAGGVLARVRDNGCGIPEGNLDRIWEPFFTTKTRGSGLGLPVVRRIVEAHGGEVRACSESGKGTEFEILLPPGRGQ